MVSFKSLLLAFPLAVVSEDARLLPTNVLEPMSLGLVTGFIVDDPDKIWGSSQCGMNVLGGLFNVKFGVESLEIGIKSFNMTEIKSGLDHLQWAMDGAKSATAACENITG